MKNDLGPEMGTRIFVVIILDDVMFVFVLVIKNKVGCSSIVILCFSICKKNNSTVVCNYKLHATFLINKF